jgi:hypothetical protein
MSVWIVHRDTISEAVLNAEGKLVQKSVLATHASAILDFLHGLRGTLYITFEEGTHSAWLYDLLVRRVAHLVVCNPRKNALLKAGSKSDAIDARKLAELLRAGLLSPVYHGQNSTAAVKHLGRGWPTYPFFWDMWGVSKRTRPPQRRPSSSNATCAHAMAESPFFFTSASSFSADPLGCFSPRSH